MLSSETIRRWLESTSNEKRLTGDGSDLDRYRRGAADLWARTDPTDELANLTIESEASDDDTANLAFALCDLVAARELSVRDLDAAIKLWHWFAAKQWPDNEFDEKEQILARLAQLIAAGARGLSDYRSTQEWEERCSALVTTLEPSRSYLSVFAAGGSPIADQRVLVDPCLLLAFCHQQELARNVNPGPVLRTSSRAFRLIEARLEDGASLQELGYFAANLALSAACSALHFKYHDEAAGWIQAAERYFDRTPDCQWLLPIARGLRLIFLFSTNQFERLTAELPEVLRSLEALGADRYIMSARLAEAQVLKNTGRHDEAIAVLEMLASRYPDGEKVRLGTAYANLADAKLEKGDIASAILDCQTAYSLLRDSESLIALPALRAIVGQLFRVMGRTEDALDALRESSESYASAEFKYWAAYARILSAETLLLADRAPEALEELVTALVFMEGSEAESQLWTAVRLLRSAVAAVRPTARQLLSCRERLEAIRKGLL